GERVDAIPAQTGADAGRAPCVARAVVSVARRRSPGSALLRDVALGRLPAPGPRPPGGRARARPRAGRPGALVLLVQAAPPRPGAAARATRAAVRAAREPLGRGTATCALGPALQLAEPGAALRLPRDVAARAHGRA